MTFDDWSSLNDEQRDFWEKVHDEIHSHRMLTMGNEDNPLLSESRRRRTEGSMPGRESDLTQVQATFVTQTQSTQDPCRGLFEEVEDNDNETPQSLPPTGRSLSLPPAARTQFWTWTS